MLSLKSAMQNERRAIIPPYQFRADTIRPYGMAGRDPHKGCEKTHREARKK